MNDTRPIDPSASGKHLFSLVSQDYPPAKTILFHSRTRGTGAEAVHIAGMAEGFEERGYRLVFSNPSMIDPRKTAGASPFSSSSRTKWWDSFSRRCPSVIFELLEIGYNLAAFVRNKRLLKENTVEFIYERHAFFLFSTALLAKLHGIPLVVEVNELVGDERIRSQPLLAGVARWCDRLVFRTATLILPVSPHLKRRVVQDHCMSEDKILVLPNAVSRKASNCIPSGELVRGRYTLGNACVIGFVGWFVPWHRLDVLIDVFAQIVAVHDNLRLLLIGDGPLRESLSAKARELAVLEKVTMTGAVPHPTVPEYLDACNIAVIPHSNDYRSPIKLFEYMAQGLAVVAPATEPVKEVITDGQNGSLFAVGNEDELKERLLALVADATLRERIGAQARADVLEKHTWEGNVARVCDRLSSTRPKNRA